MSCSETPRLPASIAANEAGNDRAETGRRRHADMSEAAGDDRRGGEHECDQQRQPVTDRRDLAVEGFRDHDGDAADHRGDRRPGARRDVFPERYPGQQSRDQRHAGLHQENVGDGRVGERHDERRRGDGEADRNSDAGQTHAGEQA